MQLYLQPIFYEYRSSGEHSVFPLTETIDKINIPFFRYSKEMKNIVEKY